MDKRLLILIRRLFVFKTEGGFSLLEVMVAMTIMTIGMLGVAAMFTTSMKSFSSGGYNTTAANAAYQKLNDIRLMTYSSMCSPAEASAVNGADTVNGVNRTWSTTNLSPPFNAYSSVKKVIVTASWVDPLSDPKNPSTHVHSITISGLTSGKPTQ